MQYLRNRATSPVGFVVKEDHLVHLGRISMTLPGFPQLLPEESLRLHQIQLPSDVEHATLTGRNRLHRNRMYPYALGFRRT